MRRIILFSVIQQLLYHIAGVESLIGENFTPIRYGEFPFIASFQYFPSERNFCEGTLITKKHVLTLAPCLRGASPERFRIVFEVANEEGPVLTYTAASWTTYIDWARPQGIPYEIPDVQGPTIVTLTDRVYNVNPVPINELTKRQLSGAEATMIGRKNDVLSKATVNVLSDEDSQSRVRTLRHYTAVMDDRALCTAGNPYALVESGDMGSPVLHARDNSLLGIAFSYTPADRLVLGSNFSTEFIRQHQINIYYRIDYYRLFIHSFIPAPPAA